MRGIGRLARADGGDGPRQSTQICAFVHPLCATAKQQQRKGDGERGQNVSVFVVRRSKQSVLIAKDVIVSVHVPGFISL